MSLPRTAFAVTVSAALALTLSSCSLIGNFTRNIPNSDTVDPGDSELVGTEWSGTDSDGDTWGFEFQDDGTIGLTYDGNSWDDASDTWVLAGDSLTISVAFDEGVAVMTGDYNGLGQPIDLDGQETSDQGTATWTVTITQD